MYQILEFRMCSIFDKDMSGTIDIKEFASIYSVFSARATREQKLQFAFKVVSNYYHIAPSF